MIPIYKSELKTGEQGWRAVADYCGYTVKHNPEKIHHVVTSELLEVQFYLLIVVAYSHAQCC